VRLPSSILETKELSLSAVAKFLFDSETQLPDDFKPAVAMVETPAHAGVSHWESWSGKARGSASAVLGSVRHSSFVLSTTGRESFPLLWCMWNEERFVSAEAEWEESRDRAGTSNNA
jgi:hypothetical protein